MKLLCKQGNVWAQAGKEYSVISQTAYAYIVILESNMPAWVHKSTMEYVATGGKAEFEVAQ